MTLAAAAAAAAASRSLTFSLHQESSLLIKLDTCKSTKHLNQIHALIVKNRAIQTHHVLAKLISSSLSVNLSYGHSIFSHFKLTQLQFYNAVIRSVSSCSANSMQAVEIFRELLVTGLSPDNYTIPFVFKACSQSGALFEGKQIHCYSVKSGLVLDVYVKNTLMRLYSVCGLIEYAQNVFDENTDRDLVSWTILIQGYVKMGLYKDGIRLFFSMCVTDLVADEMTLVIVLSACARLGDLTLGKKIHKYMHDHSVVYDVFVGNSLVDMYLKCGDVGLARKVFDSMAEKNVVSWNSMISGLAQQGEFKEALGIFQKMQKDGIKPDDVTLVGVLNSCGNLGALDLGKWVHLYINQNKIQADGYIGNALVDMYAKCGNINEAYEVFNAMEVRDVYSYTAMIVGLAMYGQGEKALELFSCMSKAGLKPDHVTFVGVLTACNHVGLLQEAQKHFSDMTNLYNLIPQAAHYGCMVHLLGRAGLIQEAMEFTENMPFEPDEYILGSLLGACSVHGKIKLAQRIMEKLVKIEPEKDGAYILMSKIYSTANRWREASKVRKSMKEMKLKKIPGCSLIEVDGVVNEFRKGDKSHGKMKEIYALVNELTSHLKSSTDTNHSI